MQFDNNMFESDERLLTMSDAAKFINDEYMNCKFPLDVRMFEKHQQKDKKMQRQARKAIKNGSNIISQKEVKGVTLIHQNNLILVPETLKEKVLTWYHKILVHPGTQRMKQSIKSVYTWTNLQKDVERHCKTCDVCQRCKQSCKIKYGLLPEKRGEITKFSRVNVDLWGPKTVKNKN